MTQKDVAIQIKIKQLAKQYQIASQQQKTFKLQPISTQETGTVISEMDIQAEVMRVQGELNIANSEIDRLRGVL